MSPPKRRWKALDITEHGGNAYPDFEVASRGGMTAGGGLGGMTAGGGLGGAFFQEEPSVPAPRPAEAAG